MPRVPRTAARPSGVSEPSAAVYLIGHASLEVEALGPPPAQVAQRVGAGDDRLSPERLLLVRAPAPHLGRDHADQVGLQPSRFTTVTPGADPAAARRCRDTAGRSPASDADGPSRTSDHGLERAARPSLQPEQRQLVSGPVRRPARSRPAGSVATRAAIGSLTAEALAARRHVTRCAPTRMPIRISGSRRHRHWVRTAGAAPAARGGPGRAGGRGRAGGTDPETQLAIRPSSSGKLRRTRRRQPR